MSIYEPGGVVKTLQELIDLQRDDVVAYLDNDNVSFYIGEFCVLELHPYEVQVQALQALGFRTEDV